MRKRPLCFLCMFFLIFRTLLLILEGGQNGEKLPASSVFLSETEQEILLRGQVYQKTNTSKTQILYLKNNSITSQKKSYYESNIIVYDNSFQNIPIGTVVTLRGKAERFEKAGNPGMFDQRMYYKKEHIYGKVWCEEVIGIRGKAAPVRNALASLKQSWKKVFQKTLGEKNGNIMSAMLLSEKKEMDAEIKELYQKNGIGHILAISGLHISFIGLSVYKLLRRVGFPYYVAGILAGVLLGMYVLMIGPSVSVLRAAFMLSLRIGADMAGRVYDMATALFLSGAITVFIEPLYLVDAGFLMSYGAILGILLVLPVIEKCVPAKTKIGKGVLASISINLMLFPVMLWFYFEFPTYSLLLNLFVIPMMAWVLGFGLIGSLCYPVCMPFGNLLIQMGGLLLELFEKLSDLGSRLPGARMVFGRPAWWQILLYYMLLSGILSWNAQKNRRRKSMLLLLPLLTILFLVGHGSDGKLEVTMLDVGQGDGIFLRGPKGETYLIDGGSSDVKELGKYRIEPFLKYKGIGVLDYVLISHGDADHCNGVEEMLKRQHLGIRVENLVLPVTYQEDGTLCRLAELAAKNGTQVLVIQSGTGITEGNMNLKCLQPDESMKGVEGNAASMVLEIDFGQFRMLSTGDVEGEGEKRLTETLADKKENKGYTVLKVAHHGSKNSSSDSFLQEVQPEIALISAGKGNRYGHPHEETVNRLHTVESRIYNTIKSGAITMKSDGKRLWITGFR